jgi:hypothetical protein
MNEVRIRRAHETDFFHRYFSPSGSIYFQHTPAHKNIYEKVYTDDRDELVDFWSRRT